MSSPFSLKSVKYKKIISIFNLIGTYVRSFWWLHNYFLKLHIALKHAIEITRNCLITYIHKTTKVKNLGIIFK